MSEIKGQLLGIILTISIFGVVLGAMITAFTTASKSIGDKMTAAATTSVAPTMAESHNYNLKY